MKGLACGGSKTKPVDYLALACRAAERVERLIAPESGRLSVLLNQAQCRLLAEALSQAVQFAKRDVHGVDAASLPLFDPAFRELCRVAGDCVKLVRDCCNPNWVPAALLLADRRQEFSLRVSELKWCARAWRTVIEHGLQGGGWLKRFHKSSQMSVGDRCGGTSDEKKWLKDAFDEDLATLQANLRAEMQGCWWSQRSRRELARYVLSRCEMIGRTVRPGGNEHDISKYELPRVGESIKKGSTVSKGGFATVRKIRWFQENLAVKVPNEKHFYELEIVAMRKISGHPRTVCFVGVSLPRGKDNNRAIVMELLPLNLDELWRKMLKRSGEKCDGNGPFLLHVAVDIMLQVAESVEALHGVRLFHKDVKPMNVLVELVEEQALRDVGYVRVKLADFGLARARSWFEEYFEVQGTLDYLAPENINQSNLIYPGRMDTYGYGILCSQIFCAEGIHHHGFPHVDRKRSGETPSLLDAFVPLPLTLPSVLTSLLKRCRDLDPARRPTFAIICKKLRFIKFLMTVGGEDEFRALDDLDEDELMTEEIVQRLRWVDIKELRILRHLGSGGFGSVDECEWEGERVAVKNLPRVGKEDVKKEAALLVRVQHSNVVKLIGCGFNEKEEKGMLVMELMEQDLHHLIRKSMRVGRSEKGGPPFSLSVALEIMWKVAMAMKHVRSCNVLHRDLKTTNILVSVRAGTSGGGETRYDVKLADFGLAKYKSGKANFTTRASEAQYWRAPETSESGNYSWAADVFSYGVVCYEIVSGKRPFDGMEGGDVWRKVRCGERPEIPEYCGSRVTELVKACWATEPKERPDFGEICTALEACRCV